MSEEKPRLVVLDTNVWRGEILLRSALGASLLYAARRAGIRLGLPEVVETELRVVAQQAGVEAADRVDKELDNLRRWLGVAPRFNKPPEDEFRKAVDNRLIELADFLVRSPLTEDVSRAALERVVHKQPPNTRVEQYRDSLIWEAVLEWAAEFELHLVSADKAFYEGHSYGGGIAKALQAEVDERGLEVHLHRDLASVLEAFGDAVEDFPYEDIIPQLEVEVEVDLSDHIGSLEVAPVSHDLTAYLTERADILSIAFTIAFAMFDPSGNNERADEENSMVEVDGECEFDLRDNELTRVTVHGYDVSGPPDIAGVVFLATDMSGRGHVRPWKLRTKLDGGVMVWPLRGK